MFQTIIRKRQQLIQIPKRFGSGAVHGNEPGGYFLGLKVFIPI
jgi:hypothetical protein